MSRGTQALVIAQRLVPSVSAAWTEEPTARTRLGARRAYQASDVACAVAATPHESRATVLSSHGESGPVRAATRRRRRSAVHRENHRLGPMTRNELGRTRRDVSLGARIVAGLSRRIVKPRDAIWADPAATRTLFDSATFTRAWLAGPVSFVAAPDAPVRGEWVTPNDAADCTRTVLHLHGGGYQSGSPVTVRGITGGIARFARARVFVPDYRRAPEQRFPAAFDDALASYRWLLSTGIPEASIAISGDSAGGGLALALVQAVRDAGAPRPGCVALISPWTDMLGSGASNRENITKCAIFHEHAVALAAATYLGTADPQDVRASPLFGRMDDLPPMLLHVGVDELIRDDSVRVADKVSAAGGQAALELWPVVPHAWQIYGVLLREARESLAGIGAFIAAHTVPGR